MVNCRRIYGFTLLEVLMALALLATVGMAAMTLSGEAVRNTPVLTSRSLARLVADNQMVDLRLNNPAPSAHWQWYKQDLAGQTWHTRVRRVDTALPEFQALEVEVRQQRQDSSPVLAELRTYRARP